MAKRSDFAQKLLDDLRLRKERLATSQNSNHSRTQSRDYGHSKPTFGGSAGNGKAAVRTSNMESKSVGRQRSVAREQQSSNQIVAFQKNQGSQQIGDFSMALAFALQNGGKLKRVDSSMLTFLHQIGGGPVDFTNMSRNTVHGSTSRVPTLTHLHIKEISRGAQKLNQILSACSNGMNFDQYSIKIGNELLKGAMDLQDSLRMLVDLQEASDVMVTPQRKNRIVLLQDGEEDETVEQKLQLDLPRFSFDKPRRHLQLQTVVKSINSTSHVRSVSYGDGLKPNNVSGSSQPKAEKGRISNVIAKLMGLEEVREEDKTVKPKSVIKDDKNSATLTIVSELPVKKSVANERSGANLHSNPMWKSPEKIDQRIHHQEKEKRNDRVKPPNGRRTQEKVFQHGNRVKQRTKVELEKSYAMQNSNGVEERKQQIARKKKGSEMASKALSKPHNTTVVAQRKYLPVTEKLNRYTDANVVPTKVKGSKKLHGTIVVENPVSKSVSPQEVKKVTQQEKKTQATGNTVTTSLKSIRNDDSEREQCVTKDVKTCVADSVETKNASIKLLGNVVKEATTANGFVTAAHKLNNDVKNQDMDERKILPSDDSFHERISSAVSNNSHSQPTAFGKYNEPEPVKFVHTGTVSKTTTDFQPSKIQDSLTEFESRIKCILLESRLFVETAQALFKLDIITEIPNSSTQDLQEGESKLVLDCGYEIMKRKGKLQEQAFHPFMSMHFSLMKIVSFDDLVKKLTNDFEKLKHYGRNGTLNCEVEDYLPRMLECDIHVRDPEINSMWDSGWNDQMFAFIENDEVVRDVERQLLVGLIEEATRDLLHI